ncbi:MAG: hypothetical protein JSS12_03205 [Verrucomicrobia bacterium]|nr:hypothetical protein [Verrucomicrobiota bacterium]
MTGSIGNNREKISADSVLKSDAEEFGMTAADLLTNKAATTMPKTSSSGHSEDLFALLDDLEAKYSDPFEGVELSEQPKQPTATVTRVASQAFKPDELTETDSSDDVDAEHYSLAIDVSDDMTEELQPQRPPTERDLRLSKTASQILGDVGKELGMEPPKRAVSQEVKPASFTEESRPASFGKNKGWIALGTVLSPFSKFGDLLASGKDRVVGALQKFGDGVRGAVRKCCENIKLPERYKTQTKIKTKIESVTSHDGEWLVGDPQKLQKAAQKQPLTAEQKERQRNAYAKRFDELFKGIDSDKMADRLVEIVHNENLNKNFMEIATFAGADPKEVKEFVELYQTARVGANIDSDEMEETKGDLAYKDLAVNKRRQTAIEIAESMHQRLSDFLEGIQDALRSA